MNDDSRHRRPSLMKDDSSHHHLPSPNTRRMRPLVVAPPTSYSKQQQRTSHQKLSRYLFLIVGIATAGTFFLQAKTLALGGAHHPVTKNPVAGFFFGRQLASSSSEAGQEFAGIADQVRKQIAEQGLNKNANLVNPRPKASTWFLVEDEEEEEFEIPLRDEYLEGGEFFNMTEQEAEQLREARKQAEERAKKQPPPVFDFSNAPPPRNLTKGDHFAACLLIKDDNHWLVEWLAYHYHVMPLRRLIVAIDPDSQTTPQHILDRWSFMMNISTWHDADFMTNVHIPDRMLQAYQNNTQLMYHRHRQNTFFIKCLQQVKQEGIPWIQLTDTDEFIAINYASGPLYNLTKHHPIQQPGSVLRFLNHHQEATKDIAQCIFMPRYMFGNKESSRALVERNVPKQSRILKGFRFLTQRFMYRHPKKMQNGKNLVHLSEIHALRPMANVHRVSSSCPTHTAVADINHIKTTLVKVHHYLGTQEQYFFRMDPRSAEHNATQIRKGYGNYFQRDSERYNQLNTKAIYSDSGARGWIKGFVQEQGLQMAEYLLKGIGQVGVQ